MTSEAQPVLVVVRARLKPDSEAVHGQYLARVQSLMDEFGVEVVAGGEGRESAHATST